MIKKTLLLAPLLFALGAVSLVGLFPQSGNATPPPPATTAEEVYTGNLIYVGGSRGTVNTTFTMRINSFTPDDEVLRLTRFLQDGKQDALLKVLEDRKLGT